MAISELSPGNEKKKNLYFCPLSWDLMAVNPASVDTKVTELMEKILPDIYSVIFPITEEQ